MSRRPLGYGDAGASTMMAALALARDRPQGPRLEAALVGTGEGDEGAPMEGPPPVVVEEEEEDVAIDLPPPKTFMDDHEMWEAVVKFLTEPFHQRLSDAPTPEEEAYQACTEAGQGKGTYREQDPDQFQQWVDEDRADAAAFVATVKSARAQRLAFQVLAGLRAVSREGRDYVDRHAGGFIANVNPTQRAWVAEVERADTKQAEARVSELWSRAWRRAEHEVSNARAAARQLALPGGSVVSVETFFDDTDYGGDRSDAGGLDMDAGLSDFISRGEEGEAEGSGAAGTEAVDVSQFGASDWKRIRLARAAALYGRGRECWLRRMVRLGADVTEDECAARLVELKRWGRGYQSDSRTRGQAEAWFATATEIEECPSEEAQAELKERVDGEDTDAAARAVEQAFGFPTDEQADDQLPLVWKQPSVILGEAGESGHAVGEGRDEYKPFLTGAEAEDRVARCSAEFLGHDLVRDAPMRRLRWGVPESPLEQLFRLMELVTLNFPTRLEESDERGSYSTRSSDCQHIRCSADFAAEVALSSARGAGCLALVPFDPPWTPFPGAETRTDDTGTGWGPGTDAKLRVRALRYSATDATAKEFGSAVANPESAQPRGRPEDYRDSKDRDAKKLFAELSHLESLATFARWRNKEDARRINVRRLKLWAERDSNPRCAGIVLTGHVGLEGDIVHPFISELSFINSTTRAWMWSGVHCAKFVHRPFDEKLQVGDFLNRPYKIRSSDGKCYIGLSRPSPPAPAGAEGVRFPRPQAHFFGTNPWQSRQIGETRFEWLAAGADPRPGWRQWSDRAIVLLLDIEHQMLLVFDVDGNLLIRPNHIDDEVRAPWQWHVALKQPWSSVTVRAFDPTPKMLGVLQEARREDPVEEYPDLEEERM